jgi:hypothetical protein
MAIQSRRQDASSRIVGLVEMDTHSRLDHRNSQGVAQMRSQPKKKSVKSIHSRKNAPTHFNQTQSGIPVPPKQEMSYKDSKAFYKQQKQDIAEPTQLLADVTTPRYLPVAKSQPPRNLGKSNFVGIEGNGRPDIRASTVGPAGRHHEGQNQNPQSVDWLKKQLSHNQDDLDRKSRIGSTGGRSFGVKGHPGNMDPTSFNTLDGGNPEGRHQQ